MYFGACDCQNLLSYLHFQLRQAQVSENLVRELLNLVKMF